MRQVSTMTAHPLRCLHLSFPSRPEVEERLSHCAAAASSPAADPFAISTTATTATNGIVAGWLGVLFLRPRAA